MPKKRKIERSLILGIILIAFSIFGIYKQVVNLDMKWVFFGSFGFFSLLAFSIIFILGFGIMIKKIKIVI